MGQLIIYKLVSHRATISYKIYDDDVLVCLLVILGVFVRIVHCRW